MTERQIYTYIYIYAIERKREKERRGRARDFRKIVYMFMHIRVCKGVRV